MILTDDARGIVGHRTRCGTEGMGRRVNTEHGEREAAEQLLMLVELVTVVQSRRVRVQGALSAPTDRI